MLLQVQIKKISSVNILSNAKNNKYYLTNEICEICISFINLHFKVYMVQLYW